MQNYTWKDLFKDYLNHWPVFVLWLIMLIPAFYFGMLIAWFIVMLGSGDRGGSVLTSNMFFEFLVLIIGIFTATFPINLLHVRIYKKSGKKRLVILMSIIFIIASIFITWLVFSLDRVIG